MTQRTRAAITSEITTELADNDSGAITAADVRSVVYDLNDSCFNFLSDTPLGIAFGGTGAITSALALIALLPSLTGEGGKFLTTDGTNVSWGTVTSGGTPGGPSAALQYNNAGVFGGSNNATLDSGGNLTAALLKGQYTNLAGSAFINPDGSAVFGGGGTVITNAGVVTGVTFNGLLATANISQFTNNSGYITSSGAPVQSVSNSDGTLTISPTTGNIVASINLANANTWTATQNFDNSTYSALMNGGPVGIQNSSPLTYLHIGTTLTDVPTTIESDPSVYICAKNAYNIGAAQEPVMVLARFGAAGSVYPNIAQFAIGNIGGNGDTQLDLNISSNGIPNTVMSWKNQAGGSTSFSYGQYGNSLTDVGDTFGLFAGNGSTTFLEYDNSGNVTLQPFSGPALKLYSNMNSPGLMTYAGDVSLGSTSATSQFNVGSSNQFQVNSSGNIVELNGVTTNFPSSNSAGVLTNNGSGTLTWNIPTTGTVTSVSVTTANGFAGTVATSTTTPAITLTTSITGLLKGNGTAISAATAGTDYLTPSGSGASLTNVVNSITGTTSQVIASASTGAVTLSLPQSIATSSLPQFASLGLGVAAQTATGLFLGGNLSGSTTANGFQNSATYQSGVTSVAYSFHSTPATQAASYTLSNMWHFYVNGVNAGSGSTISDQRGFVVDNGMTTATTNKAFYGDLAAGTNNWNLYMNGTAKNFWAGAVTAGTLGTSITNIRHGISGAMSAGTVTVSDAGCTANTRYFFTTHTLGTITGPTSYRASTRTAATSFVIQSQNIADTSTIDWMAIEP